MSYDLKITNGLIVDGTGAPGFKGDIGIKDGKLVAVGQAPEDATETLDATGKVVSPGFIDLHTHFDAQVLWDRKLTVSPWHGVTTVLLGNCGFGVAPTHPEDREIVLRILENVEGMSYDSIKEGMGEEWPFETFPEYLDWMEQNPALINVAALFGHTPARTYVMREDSTERAATSEEIEQLKDLAKEAMGVGAFGFSSSLVPSHNGYMGKPVPSRLATKEEFLEMANVMAEAGHGLIQITRGEGMQQEELAELARISGRPVTWLALLADIHPDNGHREILAETQAKQDQGLQIYPQVSGRPVLFEYDMVKPFLLMGHAAFKPVAEANGDKEKIAALFQDNNFRAGIRDIEGFGIAWDRTEISYMPHDTSLEGKNLATLAEEQGVHATELLLDLALKSDLDARYRLQYLNYSDDVVGELLSHPAVVMGLSDAGAHASQLCDACFTTSLLGKWVREKNVLSLEQAVNLLSARTADVMGLTDRGRLQEGLKADVVVFDADTVNCTPLERVSDQPAGQTRLISKEIGIDAVLVNGTIIRRNGQDMLADNDPMPGQLLRSGQ